MCNPLIGRVLKDTYRLESELGGGAMGLVFKGVNLALGKVVAIKMLSMLHHQEDRSLPPEEAEVRFTREARLASLFSHPHIVQVFDFGIEEGTPFLVMEFVEGEDLSRIIRKEGPMPPLRAVAVLRQLVLALGEMHRHGVLHRDIKPANLRLLHHTVGGPVHLKVLDFGLARKMRAGRGNVTVPGMLLGTPKYLAPEQIGEAVRHLSPAERSRLPAAHADIDGPVDGRADLYAAGVVFYEMLTGRAPFEGPTDAIIRAHLAAPPPPLPLSVPAPVREIALRLLDKRPERRFRDARSLLRALDRFEESLRCETEVFMKVEPEPEPHRRPPVLRRRRGRTGGVVLCGALTCGLLLTSWLFGRERHGEEPVLVDSPSARLK